MSLNSPSFTARLTRYSIQSPLTLLLFVAILFLGIVALLNLPREEEPQIHVPMVDVFVDTNGLKAEDGVQLVTKPLETILSGIQGVEHIYSQTHDDSVVVTVRFEVGFSQDSAILHVHERIRANLNEIPYGIEMPRIDAKSINDVAILVLNLVPKRGVSSRYNDSVLYEVARQIQEEMIKIPGIGSSYMVGGRPSQIRIEPILEKLLTHEITLDDVVSQVKNANVTGSLGRLHKDQESLTTIYGHTFKTIDEIDNFIIHNRKGRSFFLRDIAHLESTGKHSLSRAWYFDKATEEFLPTVAIALSKKEGANAVVISDLVESKVKTLKSSILPKDLDVITTRDYGKTANEKSNRLLEDLLGATLSVVLLVGLLVGGREALVVLLVVPLTILGTLFFSWLMGYTLNRVSLFALIFSIGILVDDAIVFIENIVRHWRKNPNQNRLETAVNAVVEVGNPTIVATLTIIVALLPMLFVGGLMGPYMSPIPINASIAMLLSLLVAFMIVPWLLVHFKKNTPAQGEHELFMSRIYKKFATTLVHDRVLCKRFIILTSLVTLLSCLLFFTKSVTIKMLPFDNKSELVVQLDLPKTSTLEETEKYLKKINHSIKNLPELLDTELYVGVAAPFNFNGLVRHSYLRTQPYMGEIQVNFLSKSKRSRPSHAIALDIRKRIAAINYPEKTVVKVLEVPPGPPVLSTLLAEVYGPNAQERRKLASRIKEFFHQTPFITDIDDSFGQEISRVHFCPAREKLSAYEVEESAVRQTLAAILGETILGYVHHTNGRYPTQISISIPNNKRTLDDRLLSVKVPSKRGCVELSNLVDHSTDKVSLPIFRHNGYDIEMVMGELTGEYEAPIYGILAINNMIKKTNWPHHQEPDIAFHGQPESEVKPSILWDGEWEITYVTFRDMGLAFIVALFGIYVILVAQFKNFRTPLVILTPIPLVLVGIILGHFLFKASFTATSMIGLIALAGIVVRNSLLLVEFIKQRLVSGDTLQKALVDAGATRITPIFMTAAAAMIGSVFMFFDPIFQGLAISLFFGLMSSTFLTLFAIPALYIIAKTK